MAATATLGMPVKIGSFVLPSNVVLAPMAGVTDRAFRMLCRRLGAGLAASEMLTADVGLWNTPKSRRRMDHTGEPSPRVVQIAGFDPQMMGDAARRNVDAGAEIIDINMGCPAKKVCNRLAGSALMQDEPLVARILHAVVRAVSAPVMLKTRTGWDRDNKNGTRIAEIAEDCGIQALAIHGR
ncbi:MAG: dusB, partial [Gammaproteobacteria bacterium]|nr:dusB [Gammaproteobacteria bacterium]